MVVLLIRRKTWMSFAACLTKKEVAGMTSRLTTNNLIQLKTMKYKKRKALKKTKRNLTCLMRRVLLKMKI